MSSAHTNFPSVLEDLTPGWLTSALRRGGNRFPDLAHVKVTPISAGKGFLTVMARIELEYDSAGSAAAASAPTSIVAKMQSPDPTARAICAAMGIWERECRFYSDLAPRISPRVPRSYFVGADAENDAYILLLEDLSAMTAVDQTEGVSVAQAERVMKWLSNFHAVCADKAVAESVDWLPTLDVFFAGMQPQLQGVLPKFVELFGSVVTPARAAWVRTLLSQFNRSLVASSAAPALVHTDFRLDNMFFEEGLDPVVFDWQSLSLGQGLYDVAWFIVGSFSPEERRENERALLKLYRETLLTFGINPGSEDEVFEEYRGHLLNIVAISPTFAMLDCSTERSMRLFRSWLERIFAAAEHLNAGALTSLSADVVVDVGATEFLG